MPDYICPELWGLDTFEFALYIMVKNNSEYQALIKKALRIVERDINEKKQKNEPQKKDGHDNGGKADSPNEKTSESWIWKLYKKTKAFFMRIPYWIYILTLFFAALLTCLYHLGWLESIKMFVYRLFTHK